MFEPDEEPLGHLFLFGTLLFVLRPLAGPARPLFGEENDGTHRGVPVFVKVCQGRQSPLQVVEAVEPDTLDAGRKRRAGMV